MLPRRTVLTVLVCTILLLAPSDASFVPKESRRTQYLAGKLQFSSFSSLLRHTDKQVLRPSDDLTKILSGRQDALASDQTGESETGDGDNPDNASEGGDNSGTDSATEDGGASPSDSNPETPSENGSNENKTDGVQAPQGEGKPVAGAGESSLTDPFNSFILMQMVEVPSDGGFEQVTIYEHGAFVGPFANAPNTSSIEELSDPNDEAWYTESEYVDRFAFQFSYTPGSKNFTLAAPLVSTGSSQGILPTVQDFKNDPSMGAGSFTVLYQCRREAPQSAHISLKLEVTADHSIETMWTKKCGSGRFEHLEFGFKAHDGSVSLFNPDGTYGTDELRTLEVGPLETSTELVVELTAPAQNLQFLVPYVSSDSDELSLQLRGTISSGTFSSDSATPFSVLYECKSAAVATIEFTIEIPPWDNITAQWRKDCGGSHSEALLIGTTGSNSYDVMQDGELSSKYNVTEEMTLDDANGVIEVIPAQVDTKRFDITNSDDTSDIHIQTITTTMSNPEVVAAVVSTPILGTRSYIPAEGDVIERHEYKSLALHFMCKREGKSLVLVTLPTLRYKNIEFGFIKQCYEPKAYHHSGFLQTASSLMAAFMVLGAVAAIGTCIYYRRRQGTKYTAVPTNDSAIP